MGRSRYKILNENYPYFITSCVVGKLPLLLNPKINSIIIDGLRFLIKERSIRLYAYVIMPDHIHFIAEGKDLAKHVSSFKSFTARRIIDHLEEENFEDTLASLRNNKLKHKIDREYQLWSEGFHPKQISSDLIMEQKINYIHHNPVKAGLVATELDWEYSSARFYIDGSSNLPLTLFGD